MFNVKKAFEKTAKALKEKHKSLSKREKQMLAGVCMLLAVAVKIGRAHV